MSDSSAAQLSRLMNGFWITQAIYVAARLKLADHVAPQGLSISELAQRCDVPPQNLWRLLRALISLGIFQVDADEIVSNSETSEWLRCDIDDSLWPMVLMRGSWQYRAWGELEHCVKTGQSGFERLFGLSMFDYLTARPDDGQLFDAAMQAIHGRETRDMLDAFDFGQFATIADIGGGNGSLLRELLHRHPGSQGVLFDLPAVTDRTAAALVGWPDELRSRLSIVSGDFFQSVPVQADAYVLRHIIHDWDDAQSRTILQRCRAAMAPNATLILAEFVIPEGTGPFFGKWFDLAMLVGPGGQERTRNEYDELLRASAFRLKDIIPTRGEIALILATPTNG